MAGHVAKAVVATSRKPLAPANKPVKQSPAKTSTLSLLKNGFRVSGNTVRVKRATFEHFTGAGLNDVLQTASASPQLEAGKLSGFRLSRIRPGSLWTKVGFQNEDVLTAINDQPLNDPIMAIAQLQLLRNAKFVAISFRRAGASLRKMLVVE